MPTTRPRHSITETDRVAAAIEDAAKRWPDDRDSRSKLLLHLVAEGHRALLDESVRRHETRLAAIRQTSGSLTGSYGTDYLEHLRANWPT